MSLLELDESSLLKRFRIRYPSKTYEPTALFFSSSGKSEWEKSLKNYYGSQIDEAKLKSPYVKELYSLVFINYMHHVGKYTIELDRAIHALAQDVKKGNVEASVGFDGETELKQRVRRVVVEMNPIFETFSSDWAEGRNSMHQMLFGKETELQLILNLSCFISELIPEDYRLNGFPYTELWKDEWHPIGLSFSLSLFRAHISLAANDKKTRDFSKEKECEKLIKKSYIEFMNETAETNMEFLLALVSSYGTDVRFYPSRVLEFLKIRNLLIDFFDNVEPISIFKSQENPKKLLDLSYIVKRNALFLKKPLCVSRLTAKKTGPDDKKNNGVVKEVDLTRDDAKNKTKNRGELSSSSSASKEKDKNNASSSTKTNSSNVSKSENIKPIKVVSSTSTSVPSSSSAAKSSTESPGTGLGKGQESDVSFADFKSSTKVLWEMYFAKNFKLSDSISKVWYDRFKAHIKLHKSAIHNCIGMLLNDSRMRSTNPPTIQRLSPSQLAKMEFQYRELERVRRRALDSKTTSVDLGTVEGVMFGQISPLQLVLCDSGINGSVPGPTAWSPVNCDMAYQAFEVYLQQRLKDRGRNIDGLEIDVVKLRYVEYLGQVYKDVKNCSQFILGTFTAYGPDVFSYPLRILSLMKKKGLLRGSYTFSNSIPEPPTSRPFTTLTPKDIVEIEIRHTVPPAKVEAGPKGCLKPQPPLMTQPLTPFITNFNSMEGQGGQFMQGGCSGPGPGPGPSIFSEPFYSPQNNGPVMPMGGTFPAPTIFGQRHEEPFMRGGPTVDGFNAGGNLGSQPAGQGFEFGRSNSGGIFGAANTEKYNPFAPSPPEKSLFSPPQANKLTEFNFTLASAPSQSKPSLSSRPKSSSSSIVPSKSKEGLSTVLPYDAWLAACESGLLKLGPKYGISPLSEGAMKTLYDRYLYHTFENEDEFSRGVLTGISLALFSTETVEKRATPAPPPAPSLNKASSSSKYPPMRSREREEESKYGPIRSRDREDEKYPPMRSRDREDDSKYAPIRSRDEEKYPRMRSREREDEGRFPPMRARESEDKYGPIRSRERESEDKFGPMRSEDKYGPMRGRDEVLFERRSSTERSGSGVVFDYNHFERRVGVAELERERDELLLRTTESLKRLKEIEAAEEEELRKRARYRY